MDDDASRFTEKKHEGLVACEKEPYGSILIMVYKLLGCPRVLL
jgi:hypothetical protein